jgi:hypothetical protein
MEVNATGDKQISTTTMVMHGQGIHVSIDDAVE